MTGVLMRDRGEKGSETQGGSHVKMEPQAGVMLLEVKRGW
jgi:hypothetical protein